MKIIYSNQFGTVSMSGEGNQGFTICDIDGIELSGKERSLVHFNNNDGYNETSSFFGQRIITISGDIKNTSKNIIKNAIRVFSIPGTLTLQVGYESYQIDVNDITFKTVQKNSMFKTYCVQFTCDHPHFTDCSDTFKGVYSRQHKITSSTFLPAVFTQRTVGGIIENIGNVPCEPCINIKSFSDTPENGFIKIHNKTTNKQIIINYKLSSGETITINIPERVIYSDINGDITSKLDLESYLCDIFLICGTNEIDVLASDGNRNCEVYITYRNLYTGVSI